jgi:molybdopterin-guanine dinucleotide biosynthesis protein A
MIAGVILAGGRGTRMGGVDKALLELGGRPLVAHVIERLRPQVGALVLSANGNPGRFAAFGLEVVPDSLDGYFGPLAGVLAGLDWAAEHGHAFVVSAAADTPFFPDTLVAGLIAACDAEGKPIAMAAARARAGGLSFHPTFALWPVGVREELRRDLLAGERRVRGWASSRGCALAVFQELGCPFFNVNTPEDLVQARAILEACGP